MATRVITQKEDLFKQVLIDPGTVTSTTTAYLDMADVHTAEFFLAVGATDQAIAMKLVQATSAAGAGKQDITGAAIVALAGTDDNKQVSIEVDPYQLDFNNGFRFVAAETAVSGGTATTGCLFVQAVMQKKPVTAHADVVQQVLVVG
jgi:hypothetical protein